MVMQIDQNFSHWNHELEEVYSAALSCCESEKQRDDLIGSLNTLFDQLKEHGDLCAVAVGAAKVKSKIGDITFAQHKYETAHSFYEGAFQMRRSVFGDSNFDTIMAAFNAGKCLHCLGKSDRALPYYEIFTKAVFSSTRSTSNLLTKETVLILNRIAWAFHQELSFQHATAFYKLTLHSVKHLLGEKHKIFARALNQFGTMMFESGNMASALKCFERSLQIERALQQEQNLTIAESFLDSLTTYSNIASILERMGDLDKSLASYRKMELFLRSPDVTATIPASTVNRRMEDILLIVARIQGKLGRSDQALEALTRALQIQKQEYGCGHSFVATTFNEIGIIHGGQGHTQLALQNFEESLRIRILMNDPDQSMVSTVIFNIAVIHVHNGESTKALARLKELVKYELSKREQEENSEFSSPEVLLDALELMAQIFNGELNDPRKVLACFKLGIRVITDDGPNVVSLGIQSRYLGMAGNTCLKLGYMQEAMRFFAETMRVNAAGGLAFDANIEVVGYDFRKFESNHLAAAAAA
jgi:tetratricopeptide (TPR) repeat protein